MDVDDRPLEGSVAVVTPIRIAEQVMDLCAGAGRQDLTAVDRCRANLHRACPYLPPGGLPDDGALLRIVADEGVSFADLNSFISQSFSDNA